MSMSSHAKSFTIFKAVLPITTQFPTFSHFLQYIENVLIVSERFLNPLTSGVPGVHLKVIYNWTNLHMKAAELSMYDVFVDTGR